MPIKTPKFWYRSLSTPPPLIERLLKPLSLLYAWGHHLNLSTKPSKSVPIPVICVGNITAGGSGKTPTIIALYKLIIEQELFHAPYMLTRGYGGQTKETKVITGHEPGHDVGDEPLLLSKYAKTIVSVNRYDGAMLAHDLGADCILMDDGFQNPTLSKDISILVIDGKTGFGNRQLLPAGPLRETISDALPRTDAVLIIGDDQTHTQKEIPEGTPVFRATIKPSAHITLDKSSAYIAFAGLGHPQKFLDTLKSEDFYIVDFHEFSDHHPYTHTEIEALIKEASIKKALLITTEKDYQRIPEHYRANIEVFPIELHFDNPAAIIDFLNNILKNKNKIITT